MGKCGWNIRIYKADDYFDKNATVVGNFGKYHNRQKDNVVVFSGMYGIDNYFIWYIHKNIGSYDFSTVNIDLSLYLDGSLSKTFWRSQYKILDVKYDANESKYVLFGISLDSVKLQTKLVDYQVKSLSYDPIRPVYRQEPTKKEMLEKKKLLDTKLNSGLISKEQYKEQWAKELAKVKRFGILYEILEVNEIFKVEYMESPYEESLRNFEYRYFTFDENWRVIDFINYIADQNDFEWYVRNGVLYIGNECKAIKGMNSTRKFDLETDNISNTAWFKKYSGETRPMDVMSHISKVWRCVWAKHMAGASGGVSKGCFTKIGIGALSQENYLKTLEGEPEKTIATKLLTHNSPSHYIGLGNIIKDEGEQVYIDQVSVQKNKELYKINEPSDVKIDRGNESTSPLMQIKERVVRSTPYLDSDGGILFPSPWLEKEERDGSDNPYKGNPPNVLLFKVKGKEEATVIGSYVMGNSEDDFKEYKLLTKGRKDFRFSLPRGWTMYVDGYYGRTLFQCDGVPTRIPGDPKDEDLFPYPGKAGHNPLGQEKTYIFMRPLNTEAATTRNEISLNAGLGNSGEEVGSKLKVMSDLGFYFITKDAQNDKEVTVEFTKEKVILTAKETDNNINKITIDALNLTVTIEGQETVTINAEDGDVNINCHSTGNVKVNSGAIPVSLEGHKHPFTGHVHPNIGPAIKGPPEPTQSQTPNIQGETDKHSKHLRLVQE